MLYTASLAARDCGGGVFRRQLGVALAVFAGLDALLRELRGGRLDAVPPGDRRHAPREIGSGDVRASCRDSAARR